MPDLPEFLRARFAEDEAVAKSATMGPWEDRLGMLFGQTGVPEREILVAAQVQAWNGDHITRWDPARALAECEAKRRIVEMRQRADVSESPVGIVRYQDDGFRQALDEAMKLLALPYADHPDYREEWKP